MQTVGKTRIEYIDALRGLTILLVIFSHLSVSAISGPREESSINNVFVSFRMPLFFFISGFFVFSMNYSFSLLKKRTHNRIVRQIYPTIIFFTLCVILFYDSHFQRSVFHFAKRGYWFTITATEIFLFTAPLLSLISLRLKLISRHTTLFVFLYSLLIECVAIWCYDILDAKTNSLIGTIYIKNYFPFFAGGMLMKINYDKIIKILANGYVALGCVAVFTLSYIFMDYQYGRYIFGFAAIFVLFGLFYHLFNNKKIATHTLSKALIFVGSMTLEIYLLHYFIIYSLNKFKLAQWLIYHINKPWEFPLFFVFSIVVAVACLGVVYLLKKIKIYPLLFPNLKADYISLKNIFPTVRSFLKKIFFSKFCRLKKSA